jgi:hypothetical protein
MTWKVFWRGSKNRTFLKKILNGISIFGVLVLSLMEDLDWVWSEPWLGFAD